MKNIFRSLLLLICTALLQEDANACSPLQVPTLVSQNVVGNNLEVYWSSNTTYDCQYLIEVELACITGQFTGNGPFYNSPTVNKVGTPYAYPLQNINLSQLCPGTTYQFRAREVEAQNINVFSGWTATFTFVTPGVLIPPTINVTASPNIICFPQTSQLNATVANACGTATPIYSWVPATALTSTTIQNPIANPTVTTTYTCYVSGGTLVSCWAVNGTVTVTAGASAANAGPNVAICIGNNTQLNATGGTGYVWAPTSSLSNPNIPNPIATPTVTTTYTVTVSQGNCSSTSMVTVTVNALPVVSFSGQDTMGCVPLTVSFSNNTPNSVSGTWTFGDNGTSTSLTNPVVYTYTTPGVYTVTLSITDNNGCLSSSTHNNMVTVYGLPTACFTMGPQPTTILESTIHFTDCSVGAASWIWDFGDPLHNTSTQQSPTFIYQDTGTFTVRQIVCSIHSCCDTVDEWVHIGPYYGLYAPNSFTPNGDSRNDIFLPEGTGLDASTYHLWIYDRWGNLVFETTDLKSGWDGKIKGTKVQEDVYVWKINVDDYMHIGHEYVGHVSVIR